MSVGLIVAADPNWLIGVDGKLPWRYPADLRRFRALTIGGTLILGSKTFYSLPKPLEGRTTIILSRGRGPAVWKHRPDVLVDSLGAALDKAKDLGRPVWIAGGAEIYRAALAMDVVDFIDLTIVPIFEITPQPYEQTFTYFPHSHLDRFRRVQVERNVDDDRLTHQRYERSRYS
jgi:dihydrofolate reductase